MNRILLLFFIPCFFTLLLLGVTEKERGYGSINLILFYLSYTVVSYMLYKIL